MGDDLDDAPVADLEAVAERTVDHVAGPSALRGRRCRGARPPGRWRQEPGERRWSDRRRVRRGSDRHLRGSHGHATGENLTAVAADLLATNGWSAPMAGPFAAEVAVHMGGGSVARLAGVDDDH